MPAIRINRRFTKLPDAQLSDFTGGTINGFTNNPNLPDPPVTPAELTTIKTAFDNAIVKALSGGMLNTATKNVARDVVLEALNKNGSYVDIHCNNDLTILLSSGYQPVSTNRAQAVLPAPQITTVEYGQAGELKLRVAADPNARSFVGRIKKATDGDFGPTVSFASSKTILFRGLVAGVTYVMELCAVGGSTGKSDWSEPVSKMAM
jgi:hypothetical protein